MLRPYNAVNGFGRRVPDSATWIRLLRCLRSAFIALGDSLLDQLHLTIVTGRSTFDQRHLRCEAHAIYVVSGCHVVQGVQYDIELLVETDAVISSGRKTLSFAN